MSHKNLEIIHQYLTADDIKIIHLFLKRDDDGDDDDDDDDDARLSLYRNVYDICVGL